MEVTFVTATGREFEVEIWYFSTVRRIKEEVMRKTGIPVQMQRLFFKGRELQEDLDTNHYSILQGSRILILGHHDAADDS